VEDLPAYFRAQIVRSHPERGDDHLRIRKFRWSRLEV
jgi:hypothetical protein